MMSHGAVAPAKSLPRGMLWTGILLLILGLVMGIAAIVVGVVKVANAASDSTKFTAPDSIDLALQPGEHAIWVAAAGVTADARATVTGPSGEILPLTTYNGSTTLTLNNNSYVPEVVFATTAAGTYKVKIESADPSSAAQFPVFVGPTPGSIGKSVILVFGLVGLAFFLFVIGIILLIVALVRRSRARKRAALAAGGYPAQPMSPMPLNTPLATMPPPVTPLPTMPPPQPSVPPPVGTNPPPS